MKRSSMTRSRLCSSAVLAAVVLIAQPALADDIVTSWATMKLPPPPVLQPVKVEPSQTALLLLDFSTGTCNPAQRPRCFDSLPTVAKLLAEARAHGMSIIYSTVPNGSARDTPKVLAPQSGDPVVSAGADKFLDTDLTDILKARHIRTLIVTGTTAQGAVLYTGSAAALRGYDVVVPVDGMSASDAFGELATAWVFANGPPSVSRHVTLTRSNLIDLGANDSVHLAESDDLVPRWGELIMQHTAEIGTRPAVVEESGVDLLCESPPRLEGGETHAGSHGATDPTFA